MSANDLILLEDILHQRQREERPMLSASAYFEIFAADQILKDFQLSYDEIVSGITGDGGDGGIDAAYTFVNGAFVTEDFEYPTRQKNIDIELVLIQSKTSTSFSEAAIDKLCASTEDLLDLRNPISVVGSVYNEELRKIISRFREACSKLASKLPHLKISFYYATKGEQVHPNVRRKAKRLENKVRSLFSDVEFSFEFIGATKFMILLRRQPKRTYSLKVSGMPISSKDAFICLVELRDFRDFIADDSDKLRRSLFDSNVRDYQKTSSVNDEIQESLKNGGAEDFWWLNNGVTILASRRPTLNGEDLTIEDPQIVNGLQTSTEIFKFFQSQEQKLADERRILVRVITANTIASQDRIIKATNSQTNIPMASLHATEKIHRDIEQHFQALGLFYDRRKNFYKNEGKAIDDIISIPYLAQAVMAIALQRPDSARARPSSLLKDENDYKKVFSDLHPITLYASCALLMKRVDGFLRSESSGLNRKDQTNLRFYVAMLVAVKRAGVKTRRSDSAATLDPKDVTDEDLLASLERAKIEYIALGASDQVAKGPDLLTALKPE